MLASVVLTLGLLAYLLYAAGRQTAAELAVVQVVVAVLSACVMLASPPLLVQILCGVLALPLAAVLRGRARGYRLAFVAAFAVGWTSAGVRAVWNEREYARLRLAHPFESLADRVTVRPPGTPPTFDSVAIEPLEGQYESQEQLAHSYFGRSKLLRDLHDGHIRAFADAAGFGSSRMPLIRPTEKRLGDRPGPAPESNPSLAVMVRDDALDFADPYRWGYRRDDKVAGFLPHALRRRPGPPKEFTVETVELVGLLLAPDPRVYVSAELPRMDAVATTPTRHPDGFESPALARLRAGDELVHDEPAGRLLGAIRAARQCLQCHGGDRGDLLGAFSYRLRPR